MSLMKLSPETVRLRRIAKAFAAGEFSEEEYRLARREVIANFVPTSMDDDDTQPRQQLLESEPERRADAVPPRRRLWWLMVVALAGLLAASGVFAATSPIIPPVAERDPNPATSPRFPIEQVYLGEFEALPGVSAADVDGRIARKLQQLQQRQQPGEHGFTDDELVEVARLLNTLGAHDGDSSEDRSKWRDVQSLIADQKQRRGISVAELEDLAAEVQALYRDAGYFLAVAYLPSQQVRSGRVRIDVLPGVLGDIKVSDGGDKVASRFADLIGKPLNSETITTRLYALNQAPGLKAQASFEPGAEVGETTLTLDVVPQKSWHGSMSLDNYGDSGTGESRVLADVSLLNPTGRGDVIDMGVVSSLEGADQVYGYLGYSAPISGRSRISTRLAYTDFSTPLDGSAADVDSDGWLYDLAFSRMIHQSRERSLSYQLGGGYHRLNWQSDIDLADLTQDVYFVNAAADATRVWDKLRIAADASIRLEAGSIESDTFSGQDSEYWLLNLAGFAWRPLDLPLLPGDQKLSMELNSQLANSQLPSSKRMALGGTLANRAFRRDAYVVDSGALLRVDLRTPVRLGELSVFADAAYGETLNDLDENWAYLSGLGLAWSFRLAGIESRLSWAVPISSDGSGDVDDDGNQIFWSFSYRR